MLKDLLYNALPKPLSRWYSRIKIERNMKCFQSHYPQVIERLKTKEKLTVAFYLINASIWKLDELFKLMQKDSRFEPVIVLCPFATFDNAENQAREIRAIEQFVKDRGYPYINTQLENGQWLDVKNEIKPDINFFTYPYPYSTLAQYYVLNFPESLNCYVTYSSMNFWDYQWELNRPFHNYIWRYFAENDMVFRAMQSVNYYEAKNCYVSGFPAFDAYLNSTYSPKECWKNHQKFKIIWAPHHTIDDCVILQYSNFIELAEPMIELARKYSDNVQFAFKPHPMLRSKLEAIWGKEQTDAYYSSWQQSGNSQLEQGEYTDLFYTSDAMIFDSSSFITEYIYTLKRSMFINKKSTDKLLNEFGQEAISCHQNGTSMQDIEAFVIQVIHNAPDPCLEIKNAFYTKFVEPYNTPSPSHRILNHITAILS